MSLNARPESAATDRTREFMVRKRAACRGGHVLEAEPIGGDPSFGRVHLCQRSKNRS
ncbi:hypothetical protein GFS60_00923 [Rhodococcus sp. WAY2]|nr:hypothetical protein GFS60_00923 [Rhodococcus sp. WAY2]